MEDVIDENGVIRLTRRAVLPMWASIEPKLGSTFSPAGFAIMEPKDVQSHLIVIRSYRDFSLSSAAWVYEEREQSVPRWFKILKVKDINDERFTQLSCRLVEKNDIISKPLEPDLLATEPLPHGVTL